jgi:hypothetical protein
LSCANKLVVLIKATAANKTRFIQLLIFALRGETQISGRSHEDGCAGKISIAVKRTPKFQRLC